MDGKKKRKSKNGMINPGPIDGFYAQVFEVFGNRIGTKTHTQTLKALLALTPEYQSMARMGEDMQAEIGKTEETFHQPSSEGNGGVCSPAVPDFLQ